MVTFTFVRLSVAHKRINDNGEKGIVVATIFIIAGTPVPMRETVLLT